MIRVQRNFFPFLAKYSYYIPLILNLINLSLMLHLFRLLTFSIISIPILDLGYLNLDLSFNYDSFSGVELSCNLTSFLSLL